MKMLLSHQAAAAKSVVMAAPLMGAFVAHIYPESVIGISANQHFDAPSRCLPRRSSTLPWGESCDCHLRSPRSSEWPDLRRSFSMAAIAPPAPHILAVVDTPPMVPRYRQGTAAAAVALAARRDNREAVAVLVRALEASVVVVSGLGERPAADRMAAAGVMRPPAPLMLDP